jgi:hypothetical protein
MVYSVKVGTRNALFGRICVQQTSEAGSGSCNEQLALFTTERQHPLLQGVAV